MNIAALALMRSAEISNTDFKMISVQFEIQA